MDKLTKQEEELLLSYREEGIKLGLQWGKPLPSVSRLHELFRAVYEAGNVPYPNHIITVPGPIELAKVSRYLLTVKTADFHTWEEFQGRGLDQIKVDGSLQGQIGNFGYGLHDVNWLWFNKFFLDNKGTKEIEALRPLMNLVLEGIGWWAPFDGATVVSPMPNAIRLESAPRSPGESRRLHSFDAPALEWGSLKLYRIAGVPVPEDIILTPKEEIPVSRYFQEENAEVRLAIGAKIGMERLFSQMKSTSLDHILLKDYPPILNDFLSRTESVPEWAMDPDTGLVNPMAICYELLDVEIREGITARYLKMGNCSENKIHLEVVDSSCNTVREALAWREGADINEYSDPDWVA